MSPLHKHNIQHELFMPLLHLKSMFTFQREYHGTFFSFIACNSMLASNTQRHEHNNLTTNLEIKTQGSPWALQEPLACPRIQMWFLTRMEKGVIKDVYHMTTMNECDWIKLTILLFKISLNLKAPFCTSTHTWKKINSLLKCTH